jgi:hypothetical protein
LAAESHCRETLEAIFRFDDERESPISGQRMSLLLRKSTLTKARMSLCTSPT